MSSTLANSWAFLQNWYSPFAEDSEQVTTKLNFGTTSEVSANFIDPSSASGFKDTLTIAGYKATSGTNEGPGDKVSRYDASNKLPNSNWPQTVPGSYLPVEVCVTAYGPYQTPQHPGSPLSGKYLQNHNYSSEPKPANPTVCNDMTPAAPKEFNFGGNISSGNWGAGYYYFVSSINKTSQSAAIKTVMADDLWTSRFNPVGENEWAMVSHIPIDGLSVTSTPGYKLSAAVH